MTSKSIKLGIQTAATLLLLVGLVHNTVYVNQTGQYYQNYTFNQSTTGDIFMNTSFDLSKEQNELVTFRLVSRQVEPGENYQVLTLINGRFESAAVTLTNQTFVGKTANWTLIPNTTNGSFSNYSAYFPVAGVSFLTVVVMDWLNTKGDSRIQNYRLIVPINAVTGASNSFSSQTGFLNFLHNVSIIGGPLGYIGYERNGAFVAQALSPFGLDISGVTVAAPSTPAGNQTGIEKFFHYNILLASRNIGEYPFIAPIYYSDYYINRIAYNWPFWYMVSVVLIFMLIASFLDDFVEYDERLKNNWLTNYPLYSIAVVSSEVIFTRRIRLAILSFRLAAIGWFNALMAHLYIQRWNEADVHMAIRLAVFPICATIFSLFWWLAAGLLATWYYGTHRRYVDNLKMIEDLNAREAELERYEEDSFSKLHIFYFFLIIFGLFFFVFPIWALWWFTLENMGYWLLQVVISVGWSLLVFEPIIALLGRIAFMAPVVRLGGYWFDYDLHEEFKLVYKLA